MGVTYYFSSIPNINTDSTMRMQKTIKVLLIAACFSLPQGFAQKTEKADFLRAAIDTTVNPGYDFFTYATGTWMKNNPIPASERGWSIGHLVQEETYGRLKSLLEQSMIANAERGTSTQKIGDYYALGMDTALIEKQGLSPIQTYLKMIETIRTGGDVIKVIAELQKIGVGAGFNLFVDQDAMASDVWALYLYQGGLGLPQRDYYFRADARTENIRIEYKKHIASMLTLSGVDEGEAEKMASSVYKMEVFLADSSRKLEDLRDPYANYNKTAVKKLVSATPLLQWNEIFALNTIPKVDSVIVGQPEFFIQLNAAIAKFSFADWRAYLRWHLVNEFADKLPSAIAKERFHFRGTVMSGVTEQRPRWKRTLDAVEGGMGELLGQVYVQKYYSPATKKRYEKLVDDIIAAYGERIKQLDWMSAETKEKALVKLAAITKKVGYPDKWKDFSSLDIDRSSYVENTIKINRFWIKRNFDRLGNPVDREEWSMTPQTYNAYYNPSNNEIVLPAAIFIIPGVEDSQLDDAVVYSYAGASTIGHELTHGFDDQGRQFDAKGNLHDWWTPKDEEAFNQKAQLMVEQFDEYLVLDSMQVNGKATLGENIADLGGLVIGYDAFKKTKQYQEGKSIAGLTPQQRFWLGYAYAWLGHKRPEALAQQIMTDVHAPEFLRVNGPLTDIDEFYEAFGIKKNDQLYRPAEKRVKIW